MDDPPPLPVARYEPLLRGPLILTFLARPMFGLLFLTAATLEARKLFQVDLWPKPFLRSVPAQRHFLQWHLHVDILVPLVLFSLDVVLTVLFFKRHRAFRPLMLYYSAFLLFDCWAEHALELRRPEYFYTDSPPSTYLPMVVVTLLSVVWIWYYYRSKRVRRIFIR